MKRLKKACMALLALSAMTFGAVGFSACDVSSMLDLLNSAIPNSSTASSIEQTEIEQIYASYAEYTRAAGETPLTYEAWLATIKGQDGADGKSAYQIWLDNGNKGTENEFLSWLKGQKGDKGDKGDAGVGIAKVEYNAEGNLVITFTDGSTQTVAPLDKHVHSYGDWKSFNSGELSCGEQGMFFRMCSVCDDVEWKEGAYKAHTWDIETTAPTCKTEGYDTKTCSVCGKVEIDNYKAVTAHAWSTGYTYDNSNHWIACELCKEAKDLAGHTLDDAGECSVCHAAVLETQGVLYDIATDRSHAVVLGYEGNASNVRIASTYNGIPVTTICESAFKNKQNLTSVVIPNSVTTIEGYAFSHCENLVNVVIPNSVTTIDEQAFACCKRLTSVELPDSLTWIGDYAFYLTGLKNVILPNSLTGMGITPFQRCEDLTFNEYENGIYLGSKDNPYYALFAVTNENYSSYSIHKDTKVIANGTFSGCKRMGSIVIPDGVTYIGRTFDGCTSLTSVVIGENIMALGDCAFYACDNLTTVYYKGTAADWAEIVIVNINNYNGKLINATRYYYSETQPMGQGYYWHYDENGEIVVW